MRRRLLLGSGNKKKLLEVKSFLGRFDFELLTPADLIPIPPVPDEPGSTFEENAEIKARAYAKASGLLCLADDSGLSVDALGGRPGVHSARFAGEDATDAENNAKLLAALDRVPEGRRQAGYVAALCLVFGDRVLATSRGECRGEILKAPRGNSGFGYDPLFLIPELGKTFAELSIEEKERLSHRGKALTELCRELPRALARAGESAP